MCIEILSMVLFYFNIIILKKDPYFHVTLGIWDGKFYQIICTTIFFVHDASYKIHLNLSSVIKYRKIANNERPFWVRESWFSSEVGSSPNMMPEISLFWHSTHTLRNRRTRQYYQNDRHWIICSDHFPNPFRYRQSNLRCTISNEMRCWWRMKKIGWPDRVRNEEVLQAVKEERNILQTIERKKG
jgi:hypothetical protein